MHNNNRIPLTKNWPIHCLNYFYFCHNKILLKLKSLLRVPLSTKLNLKWKYERTYTSCCLSNPFSCTGLEIFRLQNVIWTHNSILCPNIFIFRYQPKANQFSKHRHFLAEFQTLSCIHLIPLHSKTSSQNTVFHELQTTNLTYTNNCYSQPLCHYQQTNIRFLLNNCRTYVCFLLYWLYESFHF